ncbi:MAG: gamma-glutamyltransferase [Dehalococcoidia bacterium]
MGLRSTWWPSKEEVVAENGMVTAKHPLAAEAGLGVLKRGGNAVDAAVATGFAICVVEPMMTSLGGCGIMLVHQPQRGLTEVVDYLPRAPRGTQPEMFRVLEGPPSVAIALYDTEGQENIEGHRSVTVPGTVAGLCLAHQRYGSRPLEELLEPAIHYAEQGFEVSWYLAAHIANAMPGLSRFPPSREVFLPGGFPPRFYPRPGHRLVQRELGQVLREIVLRGPEAFYRGDVAAAIAEEMRRNGGLLTEKDLAEYRAEVREPVRVSYRGAEVLAAPMAHGGTTLLQTLNILEHFDLWDLGHNSAEGLHLFIEAARHAFADRYHYLGDAGVVPVPLPALLSPAYARELAQAVDRRRAALEPELGETEPWVFYSTRALHGPWKHQGAPAARPSSLTPSGPVGDGCTTHFNVVDRERNLVSCTQTAVSVFGSKVVVPGTGVLLNNGMIWFNPKPGFVNSIAPWKRPLTNMAPVLVLRDGRPYLAEGAPGGRRIINANTQVLLNVLEFDMGVQEAIAQPRVDASARLTLVDSRIPEPVREELRARGHNVEVVEESPGDTNFATPLGILVDGEKGLVHGGVDTFRIAEARGY